MTNSELRALPEVPHHRSAMLPDGTTVRYRVALKLVSHTVKPDDVVLFSDAEGSWRVIYWLEGGPYKERFFG